MKKSILMLAAGALLLATPSCKKGENDPFMSLSSRKARISGEWSVTAQNGTSTYTSGDWSSSTTTSLSGSTLTTTQSTTNSGTTTSSTSTITISDHSWVIEKDGTFSRTYNYTYTEEDEDIWGLTTTTTTYTITSTQTGTWSFVGKSKDAYKSKERVLFNVLSATETENEAWETRLNSDNSLVDDGTSSSNSTDEVSHGEWTWTFDIDQLKGKEMVWMAQGDGSNSNSTTTGSTTTTTSGTTTGSESWTLTAK